ncbi:MULTISPECIES: hypothetical protein [Streptomyces]|uniref:hypothetical protein n=1 Tax=Streptomyces TaxID=1883 RepID=UPI001F3E611B|nr:hypothetical protein [Streptomyces noursei]MCE4945184.1 hypothetical protein [Streptomyces noursei]
MAAEQRIASMLEIGSSTLRKTISGARWPCFEEFVRIIEVFPEAANCLPVPADRKAS